MTSLLRNLTALPWMLVLTCSTLACASEIGEIGEIGWDAKFARLEPASVEGPVSTTVTQGIVIQQKTQELPSVRCVVHGPSAMLLDEASPYRVEVRNLGSKVQQAMHVRCPLPDWVEVSSHDASVGQVKRQSDALLWTIPTLDKDQTHTQTHNLVLSLIPHKEAEFSFHCEIATAASSDAHRIRVKRPKLGLTVSGPDELRAAEDGVFQVVVENSGSAPLKNVQLKAFALPRQAKAPKAEPKLLDDFLLTLVSPGEKKVIPIHIAAETSGTQQLEIVAVAGKHQKQVSKPFHVRRGILELSLIGDVKTFAGQSSTYELRIRNQGDADVDSASVTLQLPESVILTGDVKDLHSFSQTLDGFAPNEEQIVSLPLKTLSGGSHELQVTTTYDGHTLERTAILESIAAPDLQVRLTDPVGPRHPDELLVYHVEVENHGTDVAKDVAVHAVVDPACRIIDVQGTANIDGQTVHFKPRATLAPGQVMKLGVSVRSNTAGLREFQVLVIGKEPKAKLAVQESTLVVTRSSLLQAKETTDAR